MPYSLVIDNHKLNDKGDNRYQPLALIKGNDKNYNNKFLYLDKDSKTDKFYIEIPKGNHFKILPLHEQGRCFNYIAGKSGSGKSHCAKEMLELYNRIYPDDKIFLVSKLEEDATLDSAKLINGEIIKLDYYDFLENKPDINTLSDCLFIFDDFDSIEKEDKKIYNEINNLVDQIATLGRPRTKDRHGVSCFYITHHLTNNKVSKLPLAEATNYHIFPQITAPRILKYLCENYVGIDPKEMKKYKKWNSRWLHIITGFPSVILSDRKANIMNMEDED